MAEVTLAALEALKVKPVIASDNLAVQAGFQRFTTAHGPLRIEYNWYQQAQGDDFPDTATFKSGLNSPRFAEVKVTRRAANITTSVDQVQVEGLESSANYKTVTVSNVGGQNHLGILITVYGV